MACALTVAAVLILLLAAITVAPRSAYALSSAHRAAAEVPTAGPVVAAANREEEGMILGDAPKPWEAMAPEEASGPATDEEYNANEAWELRAPAGTPGVATANGEEEGVIIGDATEPSEASGPATDEEEYNTNEAWEHRAPTGAPGVAAANGEEEGTTEPSKASGPATDKEDYNANEAWELRSPTGAPGVATANGEEEDGILDNTTEPWEAMAPKEASGPAADEEEYYANEAWELRAPAGAPSTAVADADGSSDASTGANVETPDPFAKFHV